MSRGYGDYTDVAARPVNPSGPRPTGPAGPRPTGPASPRPAGPIAPPSGPPNPAPTHLLPRLGEVIRDTERLLAQALATVGREADPASLPMNDVQRQLAENIGSVVGFYVERAQLALHEYSRLDLPAVGSAVKLPARQDLSTPTAGSFAVATTGEPGLKPSGASEKEPTPGSAAALSGAACESDSGFADAVAGADFPPLGNGRTSGLVELTAPGRLGRSAGSLPASGADVDFPCSTCSGTCQSRLDCIGQPVRAAGFRLPRDVRGAL